MKIWDFNNPWKNAGIFLIIANIVFFSSPNLVLFGALFLIFFFSFNFIKKTFLDSLELEIINTKNIYRANYQSVFNELDQAIAHFELILTVPGFISSFLNSFTTNVPLYSCPKLPRTTNYLFVYLEKHYTLTRWTLSQRLSLNTSSLVEKNRFVEKLARKAFK